MRIGLSNKLWRMGRCHELHKRKGQLQIVTIRADNERLEDTRKVLGELEHTLGDDDPEVVEGRILLSLLEEK